MRKWSSLRMGKRTLPEKNAAAKSTAKGSIEKCYVRKTPSVEKVIIPHFQGESIRSLRLMEKSNWKMTISWLEELSDYTAFMYLGRLIEFDKTKTIFGDPNMELTRRYISGRFG